MRAGMVSAPLGVSMDRVGSGTTWIPDAVALPSRQFRLGSWDVMLHGFVFGQYNTQGGPRGDAQLGSLNWGMLMLSHTLAGGRVQLRTMLSLDPATVSHRGYPLLLQSGETAGGEPLHDRQHPHEFWMELGTMYERPLGQNLGITLYVAPSGEPALGPVAFMHRPSAMDNPAAPLGHHWQDATHIAFGVITAGIFTHGWKLEGSLFNGREPDEKRWNFDAIRLDSYSGRISFNPGDRWALSLGYGFLKSPEAREPDESMRRVVASVLHGAPLGEHGQWSSALVYGANTHGSGGKLSHSVLLESEAVLNRANTVFGRFEWVQKSAADLVVDRPPVSLPPELKLGIASISAGYIQEVVGFKGATLGLGVLGTVNMIPAALEGVYGSRMPVGGMIFLRLRPVFVRHGTEMQGMEMPD